MKTTIETIEDVKAFLTDIIIGHSIAFHPDDPFECYVDREGNRTFTDAEAERLNTIMNKCFEVCDHENKCIYGMCIDMTKQKFEFIAYEEDGNLSVGIRSNAPFIGSLTDGETHFTYVTVAQFEDVAYLDFDGLMIISDENSWHVTTDSGFNKTVSY